MSKKTPLKHLAIIMDGNGRWAKNKGLSRTKGHEAGAETIRGITQFCSKHKTIETLTLYAFSTENWKRPKKEVDFLMKLLEKYLDNETKKYHKSKIKFETIGDLTKLSPKLQDKIEILKKDTNKYTSVTQILALNYGGKDEITRAVNKLVLENQELTQENIGNALDTPYQDIDLIIRTGGEKRISNFLLWQLSYGELYFSDVMWPEFTTDELDMIISSFENRKRNFGGL